MKSEQPHKRRPALWRIGDRLSISFHLSTLAVLSHAGDLTAARSFNSQAHAESQQVSDAQIRGTLSEHLMPDLNRAPNGHTLAALAPSQDGTAYIALDAGGYDRIDIPHVSPDGVVSPAGSVPTPGRTIRGEVFLAACGGRICLAWESAPGEQARSQLRIMSAAAHGLEVNGTFAFNGSVDALALSGTGAIALQSEERIFVHPPQAVEWLDVTDEFPGDVIALLGSTKNGAFAAVDRRTGTMFSVREDGNQIQSCGRVSPIELLRGERLDLLQCPNGWMVFDRFGAVAMESPVATGSVSASGAGPRIEKLAQQVVRARVGSALWGMTSTAAWVVDDHRLVRVGIDGSPLEISELRREPAPGQLECVDSAGQVYAVDLAGTQIACASLLTPMPPRILDVVNSAPATSPLKKIVAHGSNIVFLRENGEWSLLKTEESVARVIASGRVENARHVTLMRNGDTVVVAQHDKLLAFNWGDGSNSEVTHDCNGGPLGFVVRVASDGVDRLVAVSAAVGTHAPAASPRMTLFDSNLRAHATIALLGVAPQPPVVAVSSDWVVGISMNERTNQLNGCLWRLSTGRFVQFDLKSPAQRAGPVRPILLSGATSNEFLVWGLIGGLYRLQGLGSPFD